MSELVLAISRNQLALQGVSGTGVFPFRLDEVNQHHYAWLPRELADSKIERDQTMVLGNLFPQILGYFQLVYEGKYLVYKRKGKEGALHGKWSIGIGGHVSHEDLDELASNAYEIYPTIASLVYTGSLRELEEETKLVITWFEEFNSSDDFCEAFNTILVSEGNDASLVHVGIPGTLVLNKEQFEGLDLEESEFLDPQWLTVEELKANLDNFEDWSQVLIKEM
jgi:predicted NUDIX family phosphoesterase